MERKKEVIYKDDVGPDGNSLYKDTLDMDPVMASQQWFCASFISPEKILTTYHEFVFDKFVENWSMANTVKTFGSFLEFISHKYDIDMGELDKDFENIVRVSETMLRETSCKLQVESFEVKNRKQIGRAHV